MTPADALATIDRAASLAPLVRADHIAVHQAVECLQSDLAAHAAAVVELARLKAAITPPADGPVDPAAPSPCG